MKRIIPIAVIVLAASGCAGATDDTVDDIKLSEANYSDTDNASHQDFKHEYGVFIGAEESDIVEKCTDYETVVVEGLEMDPATISALKEDGHIVYSYLDIGSLENYRPYYDEFEAYKLDVYDNWPDEYWMDVSYKPWQDYVVDELATGLANEGFDGFFLDNADVCYHYNTDEVYEALINIVGGIDKLGRYVMINGGDTFVSKLIEDGRTDIIDGINQETVFSSIEDYENDVFDRQPDDEREYFCDYIESADSAGIDVYLLEYTKDEELISQIEDYCNTQKFGYYISGSVKLN